MTGRHDDRDAKPDEDAELRAAFAAIREEDATRVPPFEVVLTGASRAAVERRRPWLLPTLTGTVAAAVVVIAVIAVMKRQASPVRPMVSIEQWTAPTDFLLETPGRELLVTVPSIGELPAAGASDATVEGRSLRKKRSMSP